MKPSLYHAFVIALVLTAGAISGCNDEENFSGSCSECVNDVPVGPSENAASCDVWGTEFGCLEIDLINAGQCGDSAATCVVSNCARAPECNPQ